MGRVLKLVTLIAAISCICFFMGCSKDKSTSPNTETPSVSIAVGTNQPQFAAVGASYNATLNLLFIGFDQGQFGQYPIALISVLNTDSVAIGSPADCLVNVAIDTSLQFVCGGSMVSDSAVAQVTFTRLELRADGKVSGDVTGRAEKLNHPEEGLSDVEIHFSNIPVEM